jgi:hypothetical protein
VVEEGAPVVLLPLDLQEEVGVVQAVVLFCLEVGAQAAQQTV